MATQDEVRALHEASPRMTAPEIARELGCGSGYVRATARRLRIHLPKTSGVQALGEAAKMAGMTVDDIATWSQPSGFTCPNCGHISERRR
jgi:hypothetical protein